MNDTNYHQSTESSGGNAKNPYFMGENAITGGITTRINFGTTTNTPIKGGVGGGYVVALVDGEMKS